MTRRPILCLTLAALFGLSLTIPCLTMGMRDEPPMQSMAGCASEEAPLADLVCSSSFTPSPSPEALQPASIAIARIPANPPVMLSTSEGLDLRAANRIAREHAPPAYLLHGAFLI